MRRSTQGRCPGEQYEREQEDRLGPEPVTEPSGCGDDHRQADEKADDDAVDMVGPDVKLAGQRGQRHVDDGAVHDGHEHCHDEDNADRDLGIQAGRQLPRGLAEKLVDNAREVIGQDAAA
jgi:hypothetical protein